MAAVVAVVLWLARPAGNFWSLPNDYTATSLGAALNIQRWIEVGHRDVSAFKNFHYTVPLPVVSWVALRLSSAGAQSPVVQSLRDPTSFARWNRRLTIAFSLWGVVLVWWFARARSVWCAALAALSFFTADPARLYGLVLLGNDSFALLCGAVFFGAAVRTIGRRSVSVWFFQGVLAGATLFLKLNYVTWAVGGLACLIWLWWRDSLNRRLVWQFMTAYAVGMSASLLLIGWLFFGWSGFAQLLRTQLGELVHTGRYGSGGTGVIDLRQTVGNISWIIRSPDLWSLCAVCVIAALWLLWRRRSDEAWMKDAAPIAIWLVTAIVMTFMAAAKHWDSHYVLPAIAALPIFIVWLEQWNPSRALWVVAICTTALLLRGAILSISECRERELSTAMDDRDVRRMMALPLTPGQLRLWSWRTGGVQSLALTAEWLSATGGAYQSTLHEVWPSDRLYNVWQDEVNPELGQRGQAPAATQWQYAAFARGVYPTEESLPDYFRRCGEVVDDKGFEQLLVVARRTCAEPQ